jgi:uroporphyrinogen-III synthase
VLNFQFIALSEYQDALSQPESYSGLILTTPRTVEALALAIKADEAGRTVYFEYASKG